MILIETADIYPLQSVFFLSLLFGGLILIWAATVKPFFFCYIITFLIVVVGKYVNLKHGFEMQQQAYSQI